MVCEVLQYVFPHTFLHLNVPKDPAESLVWSKDHSRWSDKKKRNLFLFGFLSNSDVLIVLRHIFLASELQKSWVHNENLDLNLEKNRWF